MKIPNFIRSGRLMCVYAPFVLSGKIPQDLASTPVSRCHVAIIVPLHREEQPASRKPPAGVVCAGWSLRRGRVDAKTRWGGRIPVRFPANASRCRYTTFSQVGDKYLSWAFFTDNPRLFSPSVESSNPFRSAHRANSLTRLRTARAARHRFYMSPSHGIFFWRRMPRSLSSAKMSRCRSVPVLGCVLRALVYSATFPPALARPALKCPPLTSRYPDL